MVSALLVYFAVGIAVLVAYLTLLLDFDEWLTRINLVACAVLAALLWPLLLYVWFSEEQTDG